MPTRLLTIREVAEKLKIKTSTIYNWVSQNRFPHSKIGRLLRFEETKIDEWITEQEVKDQQF